MKQVRADRQIYPSTFLDSTNILKFICNRAHGSGRSKYVFSNFCVSSGILVECFQVWGFCWLWRGHHWFSRGTNLCHQPRFWKIDQGSDRYYLRVQLPTSIVFRLLLVPTTYLKPNRHTFGLCKQPSCLTCMMDVHVVSACHETAAECINHHSLNPLQFALSLHFLPPSTHFTLLFSHVFQCPGSPDSPRRRHLREQSSPMLCCHHSHLHSRCAGRGAPILGETADENQHLGGWLGRSCGTGRSQNSQIDSIMMQTLTLPTADHYGVLLRYNCL